MNNYYESKDGWKEREKYKTEVRWLGLRPSQLKKLRTNTHESAPTLDTLRRVRYVAANLFAVGSRRMSRLVNHLNGETSWISNGGERQEQRYEEMKLMEKTHYGVDAQSADMDIFVKFIVELLTTIDEGNLAMSNDR